MEVSDVENRVISVRKMGEGMPVLEFISPIKLNCTAAELQTVLSTNASPDRKDHTDNRIMLNLDHTQVAASYSNLLGKSGVFLYEPVVQTALVASGYEKASELISEIGFCGKVVTDIENLVFM
jgi:hypothetical protein